MARRKRNGGEVASGDAGAAGVAAAGGGRVGVDKACNSFLLLKWVVEHYGDEGVEAVDAPDATAMPLLRAAQADSDIYRDILKKYLDAKIKLDVAAGDTDVTRIDGQAEYDILSGLTLSPEAREVIRGRRANG